MPPKKPQTVKTEKAASPAPLDLNATSEAESAEPAGPLPVWRKDDKVLCRYLTSDIYYEAKIIDEKVNEEGKRLYIVHYQGWHKRHDERIDELEAAQRFKPYSEETAKLENERRIQAQQSAKKKRRSEAPGGSKRQADEESRGSTPSQRSSVTPAKRGRFSTGAGGSSSGKPEESKEPLRKVVLPEKLRAILVDDNNCINQSQFLPKMPAKVTVDEIVQQYIKSLGPSNKEFKFKYMDESEPANAVINPTLENCEQSALGILDYFNVTIGSLLLYKFERPLYSDLYAAEEKAKQEAEANTPSSSTSLEKDSQDTKLYGKRKVHLSNQFGLVHLLRLFVRLGEMLSYTQWSGRSIDMILRYAQDFVNFLEENHEQFYNVDDYYQIAQPDYLKRVWGGTNQ